MRYVRLTGPKGDVVYVNPINVIAFHPISRLDNPQLPAEVRTAISGTGAMVVVRESVEEVAAALEGKIIIDPGAQGTFSF